MTRPYLSERKRQALEDLAARYPTRRSITLPALWAVQREVGHIPADAMEEVAEIVRLTPAQVREVAAFYAMYHERPVGRFMLSVCGTLSCAVCGGEGLVGYLHEKLGVRPGDVTKDGLFSIEVVECLGACAWAPVMLVNDRLYVRLTRAKVDEILEKCRADARR